MTRFCLVDGVGRVVFAAEAPTEADAAAVMTSAGLSGTLIAMPLATSPLTHWHDGTDWTARPAVPAPPALTAGVAADWLGVPDGSTLTIVDPATGIAAATETTSGTVSLTLPAGPWRIVVNPPFPTVAAEWLIEVAA